MKDMMEFFKERYMYVLYSSMNSIYWAPLTVWCLHTTKLYTHVLYKFRWVVYLESFGELFHNITCSYDH